MRLIIFFTLATSLLPVKLLANPITIFGLNWGMEPMTAAIEQKGYICEEKRFFGFLGRYTICSNVDKLIYVESDKLTFNCHVFNGCEYSTQEISEMMQKQGIISNLEFKLQNRESVNKVWVLETYCGRGEEGDVLCVIKEPRGAGGVFSGQTQNVIELIKGDFGNSGMTFE